MLCQSVILVVVIMVLLPMTTSGRTLTWPISDKSSPGGAKNRKGLRHSPGVLMDVMRSPASLKPASFTFKFNDQVSHSGGYPEQWLASITSKKVNMPSNYFSTRIENKRRKPYSTLKDHVHPWNSARPTLNFAPANSIQWHRGKAVNTPVLPRPSIWHFVPQSIEPAATYQPTTTPEPEQFEQSKVVYRYAPSGTDTPASFSTAGTPRKARHHVRLFSNAHQYKRDVESGATPLSSGPRRNVVTPNPVPVPVPVSLSQNTDIIVDTESIDEEHRQSPWFQELLGQVLAAAEMSESSSS